MGFSLDPIEQLLQDNLELKERVEQLSWDLRAIKGSTTWAAALRLQKLAATFAPKGSGIREQARSALRGMPPAGSTASIGPLNATAQAANSERASSSLAPSHPRPEAVFDKPASSTHAGPPVHCFTTITASQLPKGRVLAKTLARSHPGWPLHAIVPEPLSGSINPSEEPFASITTIEHLGIPNLPSWLFKHSVSEAACAVKGVGALSLIDRHGMDRLIYLDSDIAVLGDLSPVARLLDEHPIVLTPHTCEPEPDPSYVRKRELLLSRFGIFNLGFFAVCADGQGRDFLNWWSSRLLDYCYVDAKFDLFTDQRWCDLAPIFFSNLHILRDPQYNVAFWNLPQRPITLAQDGTMLVCGRPLAFYHFSCFDSGVGAASIRASQPDETNAVYDLLDWYTREVDHAGQQELSKIEWPYNRFSNGKLITQPMRLLYRSRPDLQAAYPDPFDTSREDSFLAWWEAANY